MQPNCRQDRLARSTWGSWLASTAAVSAVGFGLAFEPSVAFGQLAGNISFRNQQPIRGPSAFAQSVRQLMERARLEAAAGNFDAAMNSAQRAKKIAEAAMPELGTSPDCSPAAVDRLCQELAAQLLKRDLVVEPAKPVAQIIAAPVETPAPRLPVLAPPPEQSAPVVPLPPPVLSPPQEAEPRASASREPEVWRRPTSTVTIAPIEEPVVPTIVKVAPKAAPIAPAVEPMPPKAEPVAVPDAPPAAEIVRAPASKPKVVLKRPRLSTPPVATTHRLPASPSATPTDEKPVEKPVEKSVEKPVSRSEVGTFFEMSFDQPKATEPVPVKDAPVWKKSSGKVTLKPARTAETARDTTPPRETPIRHILEPEAAPSIASAPETSAPKTVPLKVSPPETVVPEKSASEIVPVKKLVPVRPAPMRPAPEAPAPIRPAPEAPAAEQPRQPQWNGVCAVAPRQRLPHADKRGLGGWQSRSEIKTEVTNAGGTVTDSKDAVNNSVAPMAYVAGKESSATLPAEVEKPSADVATVPILVPPPPPSTEVDDMDVALQSPSVWMRSDTPALAPMPAPRAAPPSNLWQAFSQWSKQRGWTATSAAMGLAAAFLALAACAVALFPRFQTRK